jgi:hypothetical protein
MDRSGFLVYTFYFRGFTVSSNRCGLESSLNYFSSSVIQLWSDMIYQHIVLDCKRQRLNDAPINTISKGWPSFPKGCPCSGAWWLLVTAYMVGHHVMERPRLLRVLVYCLCTKQWSTIRKPTWVINLHNQPLIAPQPTAWISELSRTGAKKKRGNAL